MDLDSITAHHRAASLALLCGVFDKCESIDALRYQLSQPDDTNIVEPCATHVDAPSKSKSIISHVVQRHEAALNHLIQGQHQTAIALVDQAIRLLKHHSAFPTIDINEHASHQQWLTLLTFNRTLIAGGPTDNKACLKWLSFRKFTLTLKSTEMKTLIETLTAKFCAAKGISVNSLPYNHALEQKLSPVLTAVALDDASILLLDVQCLKIWDHAISQSVQLKGAILQLQQYRKQHNQASG